MENTTIDSAIKFCEQFGIRNFSDFGECEKAVKEFVLGPTEPGDGRAFSALLKGRMLFTVSVVGVEEYEERVIVSIYFEGGLQKVILHNSFEYIDNDYNVDWDMMLEDVWNELGGYYPDVFGE